eukprot:1042866-Rhodomonas_salina.1
MAFAAVAHGTRRRSSSSPHTTTAKAREGQVSEKQQHGASRGGGAWRRQGLADGMARDERGRREE